MTTDNAVPECHHMLARMQQITTLGALLMATVWALFWWNGEHQVWAVTGAFLIVSGYAFVLGLEFMLMAFNHGDDPTPRASPKQILRAWCSEVRMTAMVFCWRQPFASQRFADHLPAQPTGDRGVLLVHGLVCNRGLWNPWFERLAERDTPRMAMNLEPVFGAIDDYLASIEAAVSQLEVATGLAPVIVAHSMGGLAVRRWWAEPANAARVHRLITLGTPHQGTWLARFSMSSSARQMQPGSAWLRTLSAHEPAGRAAHLTCFYSHCDNIVFPPRHGVMSGARACHLPGVAHVHMVDHPAPWLELQHWLTAK